MVHIIWKGYGILVPIAALPCFVLAELATRAITHDDTYYSSHPEPILCGGLFAAGAVFGAVKFAEKQHPPYVDTDEVSGQKTTYYHHDSLFFIPIRFWPYLTLVLSLTAAYFAAKYH